MTVIHPSTRDPWEDKEAWPEPAERDDGPPAEPTPEQAALVAEVFEDYRGGSNR